MTTVEAFCRDTLRTHIAPPAIGSVKARIRHAARLLGWAPTRTRDAWYADPRISISGEELADVEALSGIYFARAEVDEVEAALARAARLLADRKEDRIGFLAAAALEAIGLLYRAGNQKPE
ncbi:hypothetical protein [Martelella mangrovi]|uniref:Uncharacterized protein n=1 Tax=Martelella mangrovi TaxID=1397477 RepID=A0ABV2IFX7_9HYPH